MLNNVVVQSRIKKFPKNSPEDGDVSSDSAPESQMADEIEHKSSTQHDEESMVDTIVMAEAIDFVRVVTYI